MERVAGLVLAAGGGHRVGAPKALLRKDGQLLVERAVGVLREAGCAPVVVVLGAHEGRVRTEADLGAAMVVVNGDWSTGIGSSLRAGLTALADTPAEAVAVLLVDTPAVTAEAVRRVAALPYPQALVCATYNGRRGHPVLLGRAHWAGVSALAKADVGAQPYLSVRAGEVLEIGCDGVGTDEDIDTPEQAAAWGVTVPDDLPPAGPPGAPAVSPVGSVAERPVGGRDVSPVGSVAERPVGGRDVSPVGPVAERPSGAREPAPVEAVPGDQAGPPALAGGATNSGGNVPPVSPNERSNAVSGQGRMAGAGGRFPAHAARLRNTRLRLVQGGAADETSGGTSTTTGQTAS